MAQGIDVAPTDNLQTVITALHAAGGGIINLSPEANYNLSSSITLYSNIFIEGNNATIDFGGGAYGFTMAGTNAYSTGTVSVSFGGTTVTGSGTTFTSGMVGQSILLGDFWYEIVTFTNTTHIVIGSTFLGVSLSGDTYVIADTIGNIGLSDMTIQNSSTSLIYGQYLTNINLNAVTCNAGDYGFNFDNSANVYLASFGANGCATAGVRLNNCPYATIQGFAILEGAGMTLTRVSNTGMGVGSFQGTTTVALKFTNCFNIGFLNYAIIGGASHGIEFISGNNDIDLGSGYVNTCAGDGIKLNATSDRITIGSTSLSNNGGYGVNVAEATCDNAIIIGNSFTSNSSGAVANSGTATLIRSNQGVADN